MTGIITESSSKYSTRKKIDEGKGQQTANSKQQTLSSRGDKSQGKQDGRKIERDKKKSSLPVCCDRPLPSLCRSFVVVGTLLMRVHTYHTRSSTRSTGTEIRNSTRMHSTSNSKHTTAASEVVLVVLDCCRFSLSLSLFSTCKPLLQEEPRTTHVRDVGKPPTQTHLLVYNVLDVVAVHRQGQYPCLVLRTYKRKNTRLRSYLLRSIYFVQASTS